MEDSYNVLNILKNNNGYINKEQLINIIIGDFKSKVFAKSDSLLLNLIFSDKTTQKDLDKFLEQWDIEVVGGHRALMMSYFMKKHPELKFPEYVGPRLRGLIQFYRFQNLKLIADYKKYAAN